MLTVVCVKVGEKYGWGYVTRLRNMVARHLPEAHRFVCLTDSPIDDVDVEQIDVSTRLLPGWWAKMNLFDRRLMPSGRLLFFDLDTVIVGDLTPLAKWPGTFGICENFTRLAGNLSWPCRYGSCVMSLAPDFGEVVWRAFDRDPGGWMQRCPKGDQQAIEAIYPDARFLQPDLPPGYFLGYRDLTDKKPDTASVVIFAGRHDPSNTPHEWVRKEWR